MSADRCATEVEEERQRVCIVLWQSYALCLINVRYIGLDVVTVGEEEVVVVLGLIIRLSEFDGDTVGIIVGLDHTVEVVLLARACSKRGVDGELSLPLRSTHTFGDSEFPHTIGMCPLWVTNLRPSVVGEPRSDADEGITVLHGCPKVGGYRWIPVQSGFVAAVTFLFFLW